ncbi:MAG: hypothetical protein QNL04_08270 [SAR324 cluster bacterium]|nr:hypothetical protein [SAR324 cluster bacterium]
MEDKMEKLIKLREFIDECKKSPDSLECILEFETQKGERIVDLSYAEVEKIAASCNACMHHADVACPQAS